MTQAIENIGRREWITPGLLPSALRAALRAFKIAPGDFVEPHCSHPLARVLSIFFVPSVSSLCPEINLVGASGFEPPTPTMSILCAIIHKAYEYERIFWVFISIIFVIFITNNQILKGQFTHYICSLLLI